MVTKVNNRMIDGAAVNVLDYGAVGDGVTDDTAAFINALAENDNVFVPEGTYVTTSTILIGEGQTLLLAGGGGTHLIEVDASNPTFDHWDERVKGCAVIKPLFQGFAFSMFSSSTMKGGFIDCRTMTSVAAVGQGGAILLDCSVKTILDVNVDEVNLVGEWKTQGTHNLVGIYAELDRPSGGPFAFYQSRFNVGVSGFAIAHYIHREDPQSNLPDLTWCTGIQIYGTVFLCNRATYFHTSNNSFAGGSSTLEYDYQGSSLLPDLNAPVVEFSGDNVQCNIRWFDVVGGSGQQYRYRFNQAVYPVVRDTTPSTAELVIDETVVPYRPIYTVTRARQLGNSVFEPVVTSPSQVYAFFGNGFIDVSFSCLIGDTGGEWTKMMTLPYRNARVKNIQGFAIDGSPLSLQALANSNDLNVINNNGGTVQANISFTYYTE